MSNNSNGLVFPRPGAVLPDRPCPYLPKSWTSLAAAFVHQARTTPHKLLVQDNTGQKATYGEALLHSTALALGLKHRLGSDPYLGLLVPPSRGGMIANFGSALLGKIPVNLNYSAGDDPINSAIRQCGINTVLTSKRVIEKGRFNVKAELIFLEDLAQQISGGNKALAWVLNKLTPTFALQAFLPGLRCELDDVATVMFSSGSTGDPKGIVLTNGNILYNIAQSAAHAGLHGDECILGCLPYFHSYGFGVTLWAAAALGFTVYAHHNPLDARGICEFIAEHQITAMASTPTFMRNYLKRGNKEQFKTVRVLMLGSEKLKPKLRQDIIDQLGIDPQEGYGCTELSPVVSGGVNREVYSPTGFKVYGNRPGTVGQVVPGTRVAIMDRDTGERLPRGTQEGRIFIGGPQVMKGYLNKPAETAAVLQNGWYYTGDIGFVDKDGFLSITDRESRFAKVGPEMVPLIKVEEALRELAGVDELSIAVVALPDPTKGEKVVVLYTADGIKPDELAKQLTASGMHNLWIPKVVDFHKVEKFPTAGVKLDLKAIKKMALELDGQNQG